jgi:hypothetical protein
LRESAQVIRQALDELEDKDSLSKTGLMKRCNVNKKTVRDIDVANKRVLVRVDFNVPLDSGRSVMTRAFGLLCQPSRYLLEHDARPDPLLPPRQAQRKTRGEIQPEARG